MKKGEVRADERNPSAKIVENRQVCPTCTELFNLFKVAVAPVVSAASVARDRGKAWGVFLINPKELPEEPSKLLPMIRASRSFDERKEGPEWILRSLARIEASRPLDYCVLTMPIRELRKIAKARQAHNRTADVLHRLTRPLPPGAGRVHVLGVRGNCIAAVTVDATLGAVLNASFGLDRQPFDDTRFLLSAPEAPIASTSSTKTSWRRFRHR